MFHVKHWHRCFIKVFLLIFAFLLLTAVCLGGDYFLEYSQFGISGGFSQTTDYKVVDLVSNLGSPIGTHASGDYVVTTTVGFEGDPMSGLEWMLY